MQRTLVWSGTRPAARANVPAGTRLRHMVESDARAVGTLYFQCLPPDEQDSLEDAIADVHAALRGEYGSPFTDGMLVVEALPDPGTAHGRAGDHATVDVGAIRAAVLTVNGPPWPDVRDHLFIIDLFTAPDARRQGLARALVNTVITHAIHALPGRTIGLRVEDTNTAAMSLYTALGFTEHTTR
ncbi:GNAT family N-acetyltransferase [Brachybacterium timonense]|uniref:GNAT family N-acetyltransferase n=1 Tax=Brachybacterium timonense TaxID=2050896 RepID=UPI000D0B58AA|nr:N-acetyltransferase [Brachybacterium timonense]